MSNWQKFWIWAAGIFALDQAIKLLVVHVMDLKTTLYQEIWPPYLVLNMGWNRGINFGFLRTEGMASQWILIAATVLICGLAMWWIRPEPRPMAFVSAGVMVGGGMANALDRVLYGAVADFLNMSCCGIRNHFVFNVADIAIFAGAIGLILFTRSKKDA